MSCYDYPDPGQNSDYCGGISDELTSERCLWCGNNFNDYDANEFSPYCCNDCAIAAERDSEEDN